MMYEAPRSAISFSMNDKFAPALKGLMVRTWVTRWTDEVTRN
jgi:hypothetical protein